MKAKNRMLTIVTMLVGGALLGVVSSQPQSRAQPALPNLQAQLDSLEVTLSTLAAERYTMAAKRGTPPILAAHQWTENPEILKYTDKKFTVVSVPVLPEDRLGMCEFVGRYNLYHIRDADLKVKSGKYREARELYRLLLHADLCGDSKKELDRRLDALAQIEKAQGKGSQTNELFSEYEKLGTIPDMAEIENVKAITVTNLLTLDLLHP